MSLHLGYHIIRDGGRSAGYTVKDWSRVTIAILPSEAEARRYIEGLITYDAVVYQFLYEIPPTTILDG